MKIRIAGVQYTPVLGSVERNIQKIRSLLTTLNRPIDLLVLPELAVTGYNFKSSTDIKPYLETQSGRSFDLARELSSRYECTTIIGYPEDCLGTTYNSALVVNQAGELVYNYRKTHLYETDEQWGCSENPEKSFSPFELPLGKGPDRQSVKTSIGICMDLNPYKFEAPFADFEFAMSAYAGGSRLLVVPTAWLNSESPDIDDEAVPEEKAARAATITKQLDTGTYPRASEPLISLIDYWILRLFPFLGHPNNGLARPSHKITAVICNRTGIEDQTFYGGSSCIMQFDRSGPDSENLNTLNPTVSVLAKAGRAVEEIIYSEVDV